MIKFFLKGLLAAGVVAGFSMSAAAVIAVDDTTTTQVFKQTDNSPCIIGGSCGANGGLAYTQINGGTNMLVDVWSPVYDVSEITSIGGSVFTIAVDINTANPQPDFSADEATVYLQMWVSDDGGAFVKVQELLVHNFHDYKHGNGESDALITGWDLSAYDGTDEVKFVVKLSSESDGFETFFILGAEVPPSCDPRVEQCSNVPEPGPLGLIGLGLGATAILARRRRLLKRA